jgi:L-ascorbate metabolism protein UlaG (beta-lactamase superfamily)
MTGAKNSRQFRWVGGPTFELQLGDIVILTDPMFSSGDAAFIMNGHPSTGEDGAKIARRSQLPAVDIQRVDYLLVSHLHSDHFDREARDGLPKRLPIFAPSAQSPKIRSWGFTDVRGLNWWESVHIGKGSDVLDITAVPARHSADPAANEMLGIVNGYVVQHRDGRDSFRMYWTGDTVWCDELPNIRARLGATDLVVPHVGAVGRDGPWGRMTLDAPEALRLIELFAPATTIPIHHHTFSHYVEPIDELVTLASSGAAGARLRVLNEGEKLRLS